MTVHVRFTYKDASVQFSHQWCPTLCDPMDCSMPGLPVHHQLPEFTQTHVHWVSDAIQPSQPLSSPSSPTFNHSQHQGLSKWVSSTKMLTEFKISKEHWLNIETHGQILTQDHTNCFMFPYWLIMQFLKTWSILIYLLKGVLFNWSNKCF